MSKSKNKEYVLYYQKKIDRCKNDETIVVDSINKLSKLQMTPELLQETGIYNIMNLLSLKGGKVGEKALHVFNKWRLLLSIAMKDRESPIKSPDPHEEKTRLTPGNNLSTFSKSSADSNASHCSRDTDSGKSSKYSDQHQFGRKELSSSSDHGTKRSSSSYSDQNGITHPESHAGTKRPSSCYSDQNGLAKPDSYHQYEDGAFNPHLNIDTSDKLANSLNNDCTDNNANSADSLGSKGSRIPEPYAIEMKENMFRVIKLETRNCLPPLILRACEAYSRGYMKKSVPYKREKDKSESSKKKTVDSIAFNKIDKSASSIDGHFPSDKEQPKRKLDVAENSPKQQKTTSSDKSSANRSLEAKYTGSQSKVDIRKTSSPKVGNSEAKYTSSLPKVNAKKTSSPDLGNSKSVSRQHDKKKHERNLITEPTLEAEKIKFKEEKSRSHKPKPLTAPEVHQSNCDRKPPKRIDSPDEAAMNFTTSKKDRSAVYSGKKTIRNFPSLQSACVRVLKKHLDLLKCTNGVPYKALKPLLVHMNPTQLFKIEEQNKYLLRDTDELWKQHCNRDYRGQVPGKNETWRMVFYKAHKEQDRRLESLTARISASSSKTKPDRQAKLTYVEVSHDPHKKRMKKSNSPSVSSTSSSPQINSKTSPKKYSSSISSKTSSPKYSKSVCKEVKPLVTHHHKPVKKADAPLMSKVKKSMGLVYRSK